MVSRHQPEAGADSPQALRSFLPPPEYATYRVLLTEELGSCFWLTVNAIGIHDAENKAKDKARRQGYFDLGVLTVERVDE